MIFAPGASVDAGEIEAEQPGPGETVVHDTSGVLS
jgi:hypothetical protein